MKLIDRPGQVGHEPVMSPRDSAFMACGRFSMSTA
jgi:hypothetical protein